MARSRATAAACQSRKSCWLWSAVNSGCCEGVASGLPIQAVRQILKQVVMPCGPYSTSLGHVGKEKAPEPNTNSSHCSKNDALEDAALVPQAFSSSTRSKHYHS